MIAGEIIMISGRPGSNAEESGNRIAKEKMIAGNPNNTFAKIKNTFVKRNNTIYCSGNRLAGNILQEAVNKLKNQGNVLPEAGNILQESKGFSKFSGNKLKEDENFLPEDGNKSKEDESNLKELGEGMIFMETFSIADCGLKSAARISSRPVPELTINMTLSELEA
jgi:hypothetical protein